MFTHDLENALAMANQLAMEEGHAFVCLDHLLLGLLETEECQSLLTSFGVGLKKVALKLENSLKNYHVPDTMRSKESQALEHTDEFKRVIQRALFHAQSLGKNEVGVSYVLLAILSEPGSSAYQILHEEGLNKLMLSQLIGRHDNNVSFDIIAPQEIEDAQLFQSQPNEEKSLLDEFAVDLNAKALSGQIDPVFERDDELLRMEKILCRRQKNNPLLVGEPGVGKTAIVEALVRAVINNQVSKPLSQIKIYALDIGSMLAGTKYRGDFEKRFKAVLKEFSEREDAVLFIDEIHTIIGAGAASGGSVDAANLMKPLLSRGQLRCIGATTYQEYKQIISKDRALTRRFQKVDVAEPSTQAAFRILKGLKHKYEDHHGVQYSMQSLKTVIDLSSRYLHDRHLPDKAIDILDEAGSAKNLLRSSDKSRDKVITVDARDIEKVVADMTKVPQKNISTSEKKKINNLERDLGMFIYGQEEAISHIVSSIKLSKSGLRDLEKPVGSFLFTGPTGVGKTELANQLANVLGLKLIRFDMSEYMDKHASSQLIGSPAGYVGYDNGGQLTEAVIKNPYAVLLLDEIEKAHPDLLNLLLQAMDHGRMTDNFGRVADFRHVIIIMTSNSGADEYYKNHVGFTSEANGGEVSSEGREHNQAINLAFSPEFRNRLDAIIMFNALSKDNIIQIVDKFLSELCVKLSQQHIDLDVTEAVKLSLLKDGYDKKNGARPIARLIDKIIKEPIAEALLMGHAKSGDLIHVDMVKGKASMKISPKRCAANS